MSWCYHDDQELTGNSHCCGLLTSASHKAQFEERDANDIAFKTFSIKLSHILASNKHISSSIDLYTRTFQPSQTHYPPSFPLISLTSRSPPPGIGPLLRYIVQTRIYRSCEIRLWKPGLRTACSSRIDPRQGSRPRRVFFTILKAYRS
jgi:hypothetical protein